MAFPYWAATLVAVTMLSSWPARAQQAGDSTARRQQQVLDSLAAAVRELRARLDSADRQAGPPATTQAAPRPGVYMNVGFVAITNGGWSSERDVQALQPGDHDPQVRGFTIPNTELTLDGAVDPYFRGFATVLFKLNPEGETDVELEEAYAVTTSLPANLQLKVGQFFAEFGRQNAQHPHAWAFVDQPLALNRMFGPEGLRSQGVRLSWLAPTPWYTEAMVGVVNSYGGTTFSFRSEESSEIHGGEVAERAVNGLGEMLIIPRLATSFELTETQTLLMGASAAFGPNNAGPDTRTEIYGGDIYWKWKSATAAQGFPFVSLQAEALFRRYGTDTRASVEDPQVTLPRETLKDHGAYSELLWGIRPRWVAGLRGDFVGGDDAAFEAVQRADRYRWSPNLTWYPTEFSKFRVQYNYDHRSGIGRDHSLWFQLEFLLGAHASHKF